MRVAARDQNGTRIVVNGRMIDAGEPASSPQSFARTRQPGMSLSQQGTLGRTTLNAMAVGNNVEISNVRNSVITINQTNNGQQMATTTGF